MVCFSHSIEQQKHFIIAKLSIWVWCGIAIMNRQIGLLVYIILLLVYIRLLTNRLHGKAAEICWLTARTPNKVLL